MVAVSDINSAKQHCLSLIKEKLEILLHEEAHSTGVDRIKLEDAIDKLTGMREEIRTQDYVDALESPEMAQALNTINAAATNMKTVAKNMKTATEVIAKLAGFLGAAGKVVPALKGPGS